MARVYKPNIFQRPIGNNNRCSVRLPLLPGSQGPVLKLDRIGRWVYVKYETSRPMFSPVGQASFTEGEDGIYTGAIGGCAAIIFLFADYTSGFTKYTGQYHTATLAHLAGSDPSGVDWETMMLGWSKQQINDLATGYPYHAAAVIFSDSGFVTSMLVDEVKEKGFPDNCITVYESGLLSGAGANKYGFFGLTPEPYGQ